MPSIKKLLQAAAGNAGGTLGYVEDVFSTYLYEGNGSTQTITNGIDLDGEGGLVWSKTRTEAYSHGLYDTERGATKELKSDATTAESTDNGVTAFNSDGYNVGARFTTNNTGDDYVSWTFRKAEKFFDVVTYTGDGVSGREIPHSLGATVGCIITKRLDSASNNWSIYHRKASATVPQNVYLTLNNTDGVAGSTAYWNDTAPTDTVFTVGDGNTNYSGNPYVAYVFAHDAGGFGDDGDESIIKCGSYTGTGAAGLDVDLGFEPQWIFIKNTAGGHGAIYDVMRQKYLAADLANAESSFWAYPSPPIMPRATGITIDDTNITVNGSGSDYIYIAIRRPMKTPESGTEVFTPVTVSSSSSTQSVDAGFPVDLVIKHYRNLANGAMWFDRMRGITSSANPRLISAYTNSETNGSDINGSYQTGVTELGIGSGYTSIDWFFKRATGFFDVVAYTGTGSLSGVSHNLGVTPELKIIKRRSGTADWIVGGSIIGEDAYAFLNSTAALTSSSNYWDGGNDSETLFSVRNTNIASDSAGQTYIAYLFATLDGISKVGSYTGNSSTQVIDCGFSTGARFVLIKAASRTGGWVVFDSARGITSSTADPFLYLNATTAEQTNVGVDIDPDASGFELDGDSSVINESGETYIFLAIA